MIAIDFLARALLERQIMIGLRFLLGLRVVARNVRDGITDEHSLMPHD